MRNNIITVITYHINCNISKSSPTMIVCLGPIVFIKSVSNPVCKCEYYQETLQKNTSLGAKGALIL